MPEAAELLDILNKVAVEGLLYAHDRIAEREPLPVGSGTLPEEAVLDRVTNYPEESVKIVRIDKTNEPLVSEVSVFKNISPSMGTFCDCIVV